MHMHVGVKVRVHMYRENTDPNSVHPLKWVSNLALISMVFGQTYINLFAHTIYRNLSLISSGSGLTASFDFNH